MKSYTDLEQSKKLAEILPIESADMCYGIVAYNQNDTLVYQPYCFSGTLESDIPCWSLAALLDVLPKQICRYTKTLYWFDDTWHCEYVDEDSEGKYGVTADNPVDTCYEMILKLHELRIL